MSMKYFNLWNFLSPQDKTYAWTFIIGGRSVGKTVNSIAQNIKYCYDHDKRFIYMRRWQADFVRAGGHLDLPLISKLSGLDIQIKLFDDGTGEKRKMIVAGHAETQTDKKGEDKIVLKDAKGVGYFVSLSTAQKTRSSSYPKVWLIIYDEFIPVDGRELPQNGEWDAYVGFLQTVFRDPTKAKSLFLANAIPGGEFNSYFIKLNLFPKGTITRDKDRGVKIVQYKESEELEKERSNSKLFKILESTNSEQNDFTQGAFIYKNDFIRNLSARSKCQELIRLRKKVYGLWYTRNVGFIISPKYDQTLTQKVVLDELDPTGDFQYSRDPLWSLPQYLRNNQLWFSDVVTRGTFLDFFKEERCILK